MCHTKNQSRVEHSDVSFTIYIWVLIVDLQITIDIDILRMATRTTFIK